MVIDLKTHLSTIIAIFLSLGIGILIGTTMVGDDGVVMEQHRIITQIEDDLRELRAQNNQFRVKITSLEANLMEQEQFVDQLFQDAITDRLAGLRCLWIAKSEDEKKDAQLKEVLTQAGAEITKYLASSSLETGEQTKDGVLTGWDFCILLIENLPVKLEGLFTDKQIYRPLAVDIETKKGLYQFVKSLGMVKSETQKDERDDLGDNSSI